MGLTKETKLWRKLSITGFIGVAVYILFILVGSISWRNYNHITQTISELTGYGAPGASKNLILVSISGVLQIIFAYSVVVIFKSLKVNRSAIIGAVLLLLVEVASFISLSFLRQDLLEPLTGYQNIIHIAVTGIMIICSIGSSFCVGIGLEKTGGNKKIGDFILYCGIVITIFGILLPISMFNQWFITGLIERIHTFTLQSWIAGLSIYLFRKLRTMQV